MSAWMRFCMRIRVVRFSSIKDIRYIKDSIVHFPYVQRFITFESVFIIMPQLLALKWMWSLLRRKYFKTFNSRDAIWIAFCNIDDPNFDIRQGKIVSFSKRIRADVELLEICTINLKPFALANFFCKNSQNWANMSADWKHVRLSWNIVSGRFTSNGQKSVRLKGARECTTLIMLKLVTVLRCPYFFLHIPSGLLSLLCCEKLHDFTEF